MENCFYFSWNGFLGQHARDQHLFPYHRRMFLGCLILLYLIFPLLRFFMIKSEKFFFIIATGIYLIVLFHYDFSVPIHMNFFLKGYEFVIGMMIGYYHEKFNPKWIFLSLPVVIFFVLCPFALPISTGLKITILPLPSGFPLHAWNRFSKRTRPISPYDK